MGAYQQERTGTRTGYTYEYKRPTYRYEYGRPSAHAYDRQTAMGYGAAPSAEHVYGNGSGGSGGGYGGGAGGSGAGGERVGRGDHLDPRKAPINPETRAQSPGFLEAAYGLIERMLQDAKPPYAWYPPYFNQAYNWNDGAGADAVIMLRNREGLRMPINVGFEEPLISDGVLFGHGPGLKRIGKKHEFRPDYGLVTYHEGEVNPRLGIIKAPARRRGERKGEEVVNDKPAHVHTSEAGIREVLDGVGVLPQDAAAAILFALAESGRVITPEVLAAAVDMGIMSIGAEEPDVVILPTLQRVFKISLGGGYVNAEDVELVHELCETLESATNVDEIFGKVDNKKRKDRKHRAVRLSLAYDKQGVLHVYHHARGRKGEEVRDYVLHRNAQTQALTIAPATSLRRSA